MTNQIDRREFVALAGAVATVIATPGQAVTPAPPWSQLARVLSPRLRKVVSPLETCAKSGGFGAASLFATLKNPYAIGDDPALTQTLGWTDAWTSQASNYVVAARDASDIAAAVRFARRHRVKLVTKGGGHSYFGNSNAANSLLVWTRSINAIAQHDDFIPAGAPPGTAPAPAVSVGSGAIWGRVYLDTMVRHGRYVQGGGCLTVGVAGFVQGGGFGSFSKAFGTGAANLLEAELVTADGRIRTVSAWREPELFHALRGGGGGTFGIVTRLTLRTFDLPTTIGAMLVDVVARDEPSWRRLIERTMTFYRESLFNPHWGEQIRFSPDRRLSITMTAQGLDRARIEQIWKPYFDWLGSQGGAYTVPREPTIVAVPGGDFWNPAFLKTLLGVVLADSRPSASPDNVFWAGNLGETGQLLHSYKSRWLPAALLEQGSFDRLIDALVAGSAQWSIALHTNKGLAGGDPGALRRTLETATNPQAVDAFALLIVAAEGPPSWPGIPGHEPDLAQGREQAAGVARAYAPFEALVPAGGTYMSEADYFREDWRSAYWGQNYPRLLRAKHRYDRAGLFSGHHCIGT